MPSPTSRTRPTSRVSSCVLYWRISSTSTETISSALNLMTAHLPQLFAQIDESRPHRAVKDPVADAQDHAAHEGGLAPLLADNAAEEERLDISLAAGHVIDQVAKLGKHFLDSAVLLGGVEQRFAVNAGQPALADVGLGLLHQLLKIRGHILP